MNAPRLFTDEDVYAAVAPALRKAGLDALSTPETGRRGQSDEAQLAYAAGERRVLVTFNVAHFAGLHAAWLHHAGIVVSSQRPIGDLLRRILHLAATLSAEAMQDRLEYLGDW
jgi:predicted nuclease of predicted toxin-antitoxin system